MRLLLLIMLLPEAYLLARIGLAGGSWGIGDWITGVSFLAEGLAMGLTLMIFLRPKKLLELGSRLEY